MMKSHLGYTQHEAQNARNLLRWEQEVFSWADYSDLGACGVPRCRFTQSNMLDSRLRGNNRGKAGTGTCSNRVPGPVPARGLGVSPSWSSIPQDWGLRG